MSRNKIHRIPRKMKKEYKSLWEKRLGYRIKIVKASIRKGKWPTSEGRVWGCEISPRSSTVQIMSLASNE